MLNARHSRSCSRTSTILPWHLDCSPTGHDSRARPHVLGASGRSLQQSRARRAANRARAPRCSDTRALRATDPPLATQPGRHRPDEAERRRVESDLQAAQGGGSARRANPGTGRRPLDSISRAGQPSYVAPPSSASSRAVAPSQVNRVDTNSCPSRAIRSRKSASSTSRDSALASAPTSRRVATSAVRPSMA